MGLDPLVRRLRVPWASSHLSLPLAGTFGARVTEVEDRQVAEIVRGAAQGDGDAWNRLTQRYSGLVWGVTRAFRLSRDDAADVAQTVWLRLVEHVDRLDKPERVGAWLATTARHECLAAARRQARQIPTDEETFLGQVSGDSVESDVLTAARDRSLWEAFGRLSDSCQQLLRLLMAEPPPSYAEVAAALGRPVGSVGPTRGRCLERLRDQLSPGGINRPAADP